ncbi:unnamed protein product [Coccothraustes coccothraustes]
MQALTHAKDANVELSGAKRLSRAAFGRSRALESTATGTMLLARRSRLFASGSRRARPLLRREERSRTTVAFSAQPSNSSRTRKIGKCFLCWHTLSLRDIVKKLFSKMQNTRDAEVRDWEFCEGERRSRASFGRSCTLERTASGTRLSARRSRVFASERRRER